MLCTPPYCTKDVYTQKGSTRDLWTVSPMPCVLWNADISLTEADDCNTVNRWRDHLTAEQLRINTLVTEDTVLLFTREERSFEVRSYHLELDYEM
jgi:hypothetical protein